MPGGRPSVRNRVGPDSEPRGHTSQENASFLANQSVGSGSAILGQGDPGRAGLQANGTNVCLNGAKPRSTVFKATRTCLSAPSHQSARDGGGVLRATCPGPSVHQVELPLEEKTQEEGQFCAK